MRLLQLVLAALFSCAVFSWLFILVLDKPVTIGIHRQYFTGKTNYLRGLEGNKIIVIAGSNGRFSHRCEVLASNLGVPCANMAVAAGIDLDYQLKLIKPYLLPGDSIYLPLEYPYLNRSVEESRGLSSIPYAWIYDKGYIATLAWKEQAGALFYFDLKYLLASLSEMGFYRLGIRSKYSIASLTTQGDESGHTIAKGRQYRDFLSTVKVMPISEDSFSSYSFGLRYLREFAQWATENEIRLIGGLPTVMDDSQVPSELINSICSFYNELGHYFVTLDNANMYSREHFYDDPYHLAEEFQITHSNQIAELLAPLVRSDKGIVSMRCDNT